MGECQWGADVPGRGMGNASVGAHRQMSQAVPGEMLYAKVCVYFNGSFYLYKVVHLKKYGSHMKFYLETNLNKK